MARAKTSPCPAKIAPQLVTLANTAPRWGWLYELNSTVAAYSVRAQPGLAVSVPTWPKELSTLQGADILNLQNVFKRLDSVNADPWAANRPNNHRTNA